MPSPSPTVQHFLNTHLKNTPPTLRISWKETGTVITTPGSSATKAATRSAPTFSLFSTALKSHAYRPTQKYIVISLDLDAPSPSFTLGSPVLHLIQADLTADFASVEEGAAEWADLTTKEKPIASWAAPAPPFFSAAHRYLFLVWTQPEGMTSETIKEALGFKGDSDVSVWIRARWYLESAKEKLGLGEVVGGNYMCV